MYTYIYIHIWCTALKPADTQAPCAVNNQPCLSPPTAKETAHLNNILAQALGLLTQGDFE